MLTDSTVSIISAATTLATATAATYTPELNLQSAVGGAVVLNFQFATAPTADKTLDVYLLPTLTSGSGYDVYTQGYNILLGSAKVAAVTTAQQITIPLDPSKLNAKYAKIAIYNNATGQTVTFNSVQVNIRKVS